jgi:hypothetical protein
MTDDNKTGWKTFVEEMEVSGKHLLAEINRLIAEGNVRKLVVKSDDGHVFLTVPLTAGAVAGGILTLGAPWLAILAAVAGLVANVKLEVTRDEAPPAEAFTKTDAPAPIPPETHHLPQGPPGLGQLKGQRDLALALFVCDARDLELDVSQVATTNGWRMMVLSLSAETRRGSLR